MICNNCKNEFSNINGLKICPYCESKIDETINCEVEQITHKINNEEGENIIEADKYKQKNLDTLEMPAITKKDINKYNRDKFFGFLKKTFTNMKVIISIIVLLVVIAVGVFGYKFFSVKGVDEVRIREDLIGKVVTLPKGTSIRINENYIKNVNISSRNADKSKGTDEVKVAVTLNNGTIEAKTLLTLAYTYAGKKQWKISEKIIVDSVTALNPVVGMDEKKFLNGLKKLEITIADTPQILGGEDVKNLNIVSKKPDFQNGKEEILVKTSIDSGLMSATGKIKCNLIFKNEAWGIDAIQRSSTEDFKLVLSPNFSDEKAIKIIKNEGLEEMLTYPNFFGGKVFNVNDNFTKSTNISSKRFDVQKRVLYVTAKRKNISGEIKSVLSTGYTFSISFSDISLLNKSKTTVDSGVINNMSTEVIISTIANNEVEGSNLLFWWPNKHKITDEEAKTFKTDKIVAKKGFENIKYVYGNVTYKDSKKNVKENKKVSFVALYSLVYDDVKGYNWKLDKLVGEDSPKYKTYTAESKNQ